MTPKGGPMQDAMQKEYTHTQHTLREFRRTSSSSSSQASQQFSAGYLVSKVQDECPPILAGGYNAAVVALCGQDPTRSPVLVCCKEHAGVVIGNLDALIVGAGYYAAVEGIEEQRADKTFVLDTAVDKVASGSIELVHHVVVTPGKNVLSVVGEFHSCEASVLRREVFDRDTGFEVP
jgi:hypothetical protein